MGAITTNKTIQIGDTTVTRIVEREGPWHNPHEVFPDSTPKIVQKHLDALPDYVVDRGTGKICLTFQSFLLRTPHHNILIDTCVGNHSTRRKGLLYPKDRWLTEFHNAGVTFENIDYVFCTHLHVDHVGWNTRVENGRLVPTFPNAKYIIGKREYEYWVQWNKKFGPHPSGPSFEECVLPIVEADRAILVNDDFELYDLVHLSPAPGHTPGQCCANLSSNGKKAIFAGDALHHPLQAFEPQWSTSKCEDPKMAIVSRQKILESCADTETILIPAHFPGNTAGNVYSASEKFVFKFIEK